MKTKSLILLLKEYIHTELPTSTFLPYFVHYLKENTVRFFLQKYVFVNFDFFFFFFFSYTGSEIYHELFMLWKRWS